MAQSLKLTPSERLQYALGLVAWAMRINPHLMKNRDRLLRRRSAP